MTAREDVPALIADNRKWVRWHRENKYQKEAARRMSLVLDALESLDAQHAAVRDGYRAQVTKTSEAIAARIAAEHARDQLAARIERLETTLASAPTDALREVKASAIREYVEAARENPHTQYWPASGVLDDAEQWADEIEKGGV